jgi:L-threonylcarbamoyladenylate synthase
MASDFSIRHAAHIVRHGGIIAYPTDTIYGLGCDPFNADAVERINTIKQRPANKQLILLAAHIDQVRPLIILDSEHESLISQSTEPTSWIAEAAKHIPDWLTDNNGALTFRISNHDCVQRLCNTLGHALISTSANISGRAPARSSLEIHHYFHSTVDKILASNQKLTGKPSKIIRLCDNHIVRQ